MLKPLSPSLLGTGLYFDISSLKKKDSHQPENITIDESERIREVIISAREQGLSEIIVEVSKEFADQFTMGGNIPIEGININAEAKASGSKNGKVLLSLKLNPDDIYFQIEKLARLHAKGILSDSEFTLAKKNLIEKI
ncbi:TPA: SHOCT domain-containing protein [Photobacterium damselae]